MSTLTHGQHRVVRHVLLAVIFLSLSLIFAHFFAKRDPISRVSIGTAYSSVFLAGLAVVLGPWNVLRRRSNPISFDLRRDIGIWAGIGALVHTGVGLNVHLRGRPWLYFFDEHHHLRAGLFGIGNYTGLIAALLFMMLLAISNDLSLRRLGSGRWKALQRWTYAAIILTAAHAVAYQGVEKRTSIFRFLIYAVFSAILILQVAGVVRRKQLSRNRSSA